LKDTKKILRAAIYTALNGNITYNSTAVPTYDEKTSVTNTANVFILLSGQQETDVENNDSVFITRSAIDIDIWQKTGSEVSKDGIDTVYESMMEILIPTPQTVGLTIPSGFQFQNATRESATTGSVELSPTESVLVCRVKLVFTIVQK
jgi:hypothetical protein